MMSIYLLQASSLRTSSDLSVSGTDNGFMAAWIGNDHNIYASFSFDQGNTWGSPIQITFDQSVSPHLTNSTFQSFIGISGVDNGFMLTWLNGDHNAYSCFLTVTVLSAATFNGIVTKTRFLSQTDIIKRLSWTASKDPTVVGYNLYRNGTLLTNVGIAGPFIYADHNRHPNIVDTYLLTSFNKAGMESTPLTFKL